MRRTLRYVLTPEDRATHAKWARAVAIVYGGVALILFGLVVIGEPLGVVAPDRPADRSVASATTSGWTTQPAACRGRHDMSCADIPAGE